jgi:hypothetical protein
MDTIAREPMQRGECRVSIARDDLVFSSAHFMTSKDTPFTDAQIVTQLDGSPANSTTLRCGDRRRAGR